MSDRIDWYRMIRSDPLIRERVRLVQHSVARGKSEAPSLRTPAAVVAEQRMMAALAGLDRISWELGPSIFDPSVKGRLPEIYGRLILDAIPFWWTSETDSLIGPLPLPRHTIAQIRLPVPVMWIALDSQHGEIQNIILRQVPPQPPGISGGIEVTYIRDTGERIEGLAEFLAHRMRYPEDVRPGLFAEVILKFLAFIASPYTEPSVIRASRADRRTIARAGFQYEPEVHVVKLRARLKEPEQRTGDQISGTHHWQHRWWVRGHFRAQWYPSEQSHKVIWVAPYVKGPDDAPVKSAVYAVVR